MNETLGKIECPMCGEEADLRRCSKGAKTWYWVCRCGKITPNCAPGQAWIMERGSIFGAAQDEPVKVTVETVVEEEQPKPAAAVAKKDDGWFNW